MNEIKQKAALINAMIGKNSPDWEETLEMKYSDFEESTKPDIDGYVFLKDKNLKVKLGIATDIDGDEDFINGIIKEAYFSLDGKEYQPYSHFTEEYMERMLEKGDLLKEGEKELKDMEKAIKKEEKAAEKEMKALKKEYEVKAAADNQYLSEAMSLLDKIDADVDVHVEDKIETYEAIKTEAHNYVVFYQEAEKDLHKHLKKEGAMASASSTKEIAEILTILNSSDNKADKYPFGNKELTQKVKKLEKEEAIYYHPKFMKWKKGGNKAKADSNPSLHDNILDSMTWGEFMETISSNEQRPWSKATAVKVFYEIMDKKKKDAILELDSNMDFVVKQGTSASAEEMPAAVTEEMFLNPEQFDKALKVIQTTQKELKECHHALLAIRGELDDVRKAKMDEILGKLQSMEHSFLDGVSNPICGKMEEATPVMESPIELEISKEINLDVPSMEEDIMVEGNTQPNPELESSK